MVASWQLHEVQPNKRFTSAWCFTEEHLYHSLCGRETWMRALLWPLFTEGKWRPCRRELPQVVDSWEGTARIFNLVCSSWFCCSIPLILVPVQRLLILGWGVLGSPFIWACWAHQIQLNRKVRSKSKREGADHLSKAGVTTQHVIICFLKVIYWVEIHIAQN